MKEIEQIVNKVALEEYPIDNQKDVDGDWNDINNHKREAFKAGCYNMILIMSKGLESQKDGGKN